MNKEGRLYCQGTNFRRYGNRVIAREVQACGIALLAVVNTFQGMSSRVRQRPRSTQAGPDVCLRNVDIVLVTACSLCALALVGPARWAPGARTSAAWFGVFALGPLVLRSLEATWPRQRLVRWAADFWLLPVASVGHELLGPLVDALTPVLRDAELVALEQRLFGTHVSVLASNAVPPWLSDVLLFSYYGHFLWALALGVVLYVHRRRAAFDEFLLALSLFFSLNYMLYALVPAIGPRFFLFHAFSAPLTGPLLTPWLDSVMRMPAFMRDCFPSGHTGATLLVLLYSFRFARRFFWVALVPGLCLITATLSGRFHYAVDLVAAVPVTVVVAGLAMAFSRATSGGRSFESRRSVPMNAIVRP